MSEGHALTVADVYGLMRRASREMGSQRAFARKVGVSEAFISAVLNGARPPTAAILKEVGLKLVVKYEREE